MPRGYKRSNGSPGDFVSLRVGSAWASFIEGHNLGHQPWSPARLGLHAVVALQMALGFYGTWHSGPSLLDERCRDLGG